MNRNTIVQPSSVSKGNAKPLVSGIPKRTIKFRALKDDMSNCNFYYGQLVYDAIGQPRITEVDKSVQGLTFHTCIKGTESQFIGFKDCKKREIYTGDIVKWGHKKNSSECWHRYAIVQINPDLQLKIIYYKVAETKEQKPTDNHIFHWGRFAYGGSDLEIIGNVFQNPELLW
jgi:YopX protein